MHSFDVSWEKEARVLELLQELNDLSYDKLQIQVNHVAEGDGRVITIYSKESQIVHRNYGSRVERRVAELLEDLGVNIKSENYRETPRRVARYFRDHFGTVEEYVRQFEEMKSATFPSEYDGIVTVGPTKSFGVCPHHLLPVVYTITVGYIPKGRCIGLSKLSRIPKLVSKFPSLQEDITREIASVLSDLLGTDDVAVLVEGQHQCMQVRGVEEDGAITTTSTMWGRFTEDEGGCKSEFLRIADRNRRDR